MRNLKRVSGNVYFCDFGAAAGGQARPYFGAEGVLADSPRPELTQVARGDVPASDTAALVQDSMFDPIVA